MSLSLSSLYTCLPYSPRYLPTLLPALILLTVFLFIVLILVPLFLPVFVLHILLSFNLPSPCYFCCSSFISFNPAVHEHCVDLPCDHHASKWHRRAASWSTRRPCYEKPTRIQSYFAARQVMTVAMFIYLFIHWFLCVFISFTCLSVYTFTRLSIHLFIWYI